MQFEKKVIAHLNKCYSIAPLTCNGSQHFLVAAEKEDSCLLFNMDCQLVDTIWEKPGGVMSMAQLPGSNGCFLATWKFYSPNDSANAEIVLAEPGANGGWQTRTICPLPFVHRFDILTAGGRNYLIACTLKSGHSHKDDWSSPGKVYAALLPEDLSDITEEHPLPLHVIKENLLKNHGFSKIRTAQGESALISSADGVFQMTPPASDLYGWTIGKLLDSPVSDAAMIDLDGDGVDELITISPFHGSAICIYHLEETGYQPVYTYEKEAEFSHAIWCGTLGGRKAAVLGHREGRRALLLFLFDDKTNQYTVQTIDENCGPSNVTLIEDKEHSFLVAANRETNEIASYRLIS